MAMLFGGLLALVHAFFCIHLRADQIVSGFAVNFLALGLTGFLYSSIYPGGIDQQVSRVPDVELSFLDDIPVVGDFLDGVFGSLNLLVWIMFAVVLLAYIVLFKTPIGLRIRSVGEHPRAAETVGISVYGVRYASVVTSGSARRARRRVPLDRLRRHLHREHDGRSRLHRARGGDLRQMAAGVGLRGDAPLRIRLRARHSAPARSRHLGEPGLHASRTSSRSSRSSV